MSLSVRPVSQENISAFYDLIQEQAEQHAAADHGEKEQHTQKLLEAVCETKEINAFLVCDRNAALCAVTYVECWDGRAPGLYLEDIVTRRSHRQHGIGRFAMQTLAQETLRGGYASLSWECAAHNHAAQRFYDNLGSGRREDRVTWRMPEDALARAPKIKLSGCVRSFPLSGNIIDLSFCEAAEEAGARAVSYHSYSTFRLVSGMHMENIYVPDQNPRTASALVRAQILYQQKQGWTGHFDLTVKEAEAAYLAPVLERFGFEPLSYGEDKMVPRYLRGQALYHLAYGQQARAQSHLNVA